MMKKRIAIAAGGDSGEYEISIKSAAVVEQHLDKELYEPYLVIFKGREWSHTDIDGNKYLVNKDDFSLFIGNDKITFDAVGDFNVKLTVTNDLGSHNITKANYIHVGTVGIGESSLEENLSLYPNPSTGNFTLDLGQSGVNDVRISILDARGEVVFEKFLPDDTQKYNIDISEQPAGVYMLRLQSGEIQIDRKITLIN